MDTYTLADLTKLTGAKRRSVQFWAEAGALKAEAETERSGSGTHRRFGRDEAIIACVLHQFAQQQIAIGHLIEVSVGFRHLLDMHDGKVRHVVERAIEDDGKNFYLYVPTTSERKGVVFTDEDGIEPSFFQILKDLEVDVSFVAVIDLNIALSSVRDYRS